MIDSAVKPGSAEGLRLSVAVIDAGGVPRGDADGVVIGAMGISGRIGEQDDAVATTATTA